MIDLVLLAACWTCSWETLRKYLKIISGISTWGKFKDVLSVLDATF